MLTHSLELFWMKHADKQNFLVIHSFCENVLGIRIKNLNVK